MSSISSDDIDLTIPINQPMMSLVCSTIRPEDDYFTNTEEAIDFLIEEKEDDEFVIINKDKVPPVPNVDPLQKIATTIANIFKTDVVPQLSVACDYGIVGCGFVYYGAIAGSEMLTTQGKEMVKKISWVDLGCPFNMWTYSGLAQVKYVFENFSATHNQVIQEMWI